MASEGRESEGDANRRMLDYWWHTGTHSTCTTSSATASTRPTLSQLGNTHHAANDLETVGGAWKQVLNMLEDRHHSDADLLRAKLGQIPATTNRFCPLRRRLAEGKLGPYCHARSE